MKNVFIAASCLLIVIGKAQKLIDVDKTTGFPQNAFFNVGGEPFVNVKFVRLTSGSPYFKDEWINGTGLSGTGITYKAGVLKSNLLENKINF